VRTRRPYPRLVILAVTIGALAGVTSACSVNPPPAVITDPKYPDFVPLTVPASLHASAEVVSRQDVAWRRLQSGDLSGARRDFTAILQERTDFFPAAAGLGYVALAGHDYKLAATQFNAALRANDRYRPALDGRATAAISSGDDLAAATALQAILKVDPGDDSARSRLEVVRSRQVQHAIDAERHLRDGGHLDEALAVLQPVMGEAPGAVLLSELALLQLAKGNLTAAEDSARKATRTDPGDGEAWAALGDVLDKAGRTADAADAMDKAFAVDPRPEWRDRRDVFRTRALEASEPKAFRDIASATSVTRADVAAMIGLRLPEVLEGSPRRVTVVATDARGSWASAWILQVTQAGVMDVYANHTFQPEAVVRRSTLAEVVSRLLSVLSAERGTDLSRWKTATPAFGDVPAGSPGYAAAALAVVSGAMSAPTGRFSGSQPATGADLVAAVARLQQLAR
jgi:tetratricopeptide (TPR) repeat protein